MVCLYTVESYRDELKLMKGTDSTSSSMRKTYEQFMDIPHDIELEEQLAAKTAKCDELTTENA